MTIQRNIALNSIKYHPPRHKISPHPTYPDRVSSLLLRSISPLPSRERVGTKKSAGKPGKRARPRISEPLCIPPSDKSGARMVIHGQVNKSITVLILPERPHTFFFPVPYLEHITLDLRAYFPLKQTVVRDKQCFLEGNGCEKGSKSWLKMMKNERNLGAPEREQSFC